MNSEKINFAALKAELTNFPPIGRETKLRRFLSTSPNCIDAWYMLIQLVMMNDNSVEAVRLSTLALKYFKDDLRFLNSHIDLLLNLGFFDDARRHLDQLTSGVNATIDNELDIVEIKFSRDPSRGLPIFQKYSAKNPMNIRVVVGMLSARSFQNFGPSKICFLLSSDWHWPIQKSVTQALDKLQISYYVTTRFWMLKILQPAVIVISDAAPAIIKWIRLNLPCAKIVSTRHGVGVGGKNYGLYAAAATDYICVSSESLKQDLCRDALLNEDRVWVTGFSQMDSLFRVSVPAPPISSFKRVTFAPTFDPKLSAVEVIGDNPVHWIRKENKKIHLTIRPHPHLFRSFPAVMNRWREIIKKEKNVIFDDSPFSELSSVLIKTDLLISDISSVALQFLALNKPLICVVDPEQARLSPKYAPEELEWKMHAAAVLVRRKEELHTAVEAALTGPVDPKILTEKMRMREYLFGGMTDGRAGERIAERLVRLTEVKN